MGIFSRRTNPADRFVGQSGTAVVAPPPIDEMTQRVVGFSTRLLLGGELMSSYGWTQDVVAKRREASLRLVQEIDYELGAGTVEALYGTSVEDALTPGPEGRTLLGSRSSSREAFFNRSLWYLHESGLKAAPDGSIQLSAVAVGAVMSGRLAIGAVPVTVEAGMKGLADLPIVDQQTRERLRVGFEVMAGLAEDPMLFDDTVHFHSENQGLLPDPNFTMHTASVDEEGALTTEQITPGATWAAQMELQVRHSDNLGL